MDRNSGNQNSATPKKFGLPGGLDLNQLLVLGFSFIVGVIIVIAVATGEGDETATAPDGEQELARSVGNPSTPFRSADESADGEVVAQVAGVTCELDILADGATSVDVLESWNSAVVSTGDSCVAPFADTLGSDWLLTDAELSIFGTDGSLYEFANGDDGLESFGVFLVIEDSLNGETNELTALIETVWGADEIDWENACDETTRSWSGSVATDGLAIEILSCANAR